MQRIHEEGDASIAYYMGTRSFVDDIVAIAEHHGKWRDAETRRLLENDQTNVPSQKKQQLLADRRWQPGEEKLLYWGTSYGTLPGITLAAMYPNRVHRMVLDSVSSPQFFFNMSLDNSLIHSDEIFAQFIHLCHKHGPDHCKFYRESEDEIAREIADLTSGLHSSPLPVPATLNRGPDLITWSDMKRLIGSSVYHPRRSFPLLANILQDMSQGNGSSFADYKAQSNAVTSEDVRKGLYNLSKQCKEQGPFSAACNYPGEWTEEGLLGIQCGDRDLPGDMTEEHFRSYWNDARNQSATLGDIWAEWDLMCVGWKAKTRWRYDGKTNLHYNN